MVDQAQMAARLSDKELDRATDSVIKYLAGEEQSPEAAKAARALLNTLPKEELDELKSAPDKQNEAEEIGDVLFCIVNYARMKGHDAEELLTATNRKFESRFKSMEQRLTAQSLTLETATLDQMLAAWKVKK